MGRMMRQVLLLMALLLAMNIKADTFNMHFSVQHWKEESSGYFGEAKDSTINPVWSKPTENQFRFEIQHPLPLLPHVIVDYGELNLSGSVTLAQTYRLGSQLYSVASVLDASASYSKRDFTFYYELLDASIIDVDLGVQVRYLEAEYKVLEQLNQLSSSREVSAWLPRGFLRLSSSLPLIGIQSYVQVAMDNDSQDLEAAIGYRLIESVFADMSIYLGYRDSQFTMSDIENIYAKNDSQAVFVSLDVAF